LRKDLKRIAVIGPLADDYDSPFGSWFAAAESRHVISVLEEIQDVFSSGITVMCEKGCDVEGYIM
jgi:beta-glucosidase